jgi:hypothetical protein
MIWALVLQRRARDDFGPTIRGTFGFLQLPNPKDHIELLNERGRCDILQVEYIRHTPMNNADGQPEPAVQIVCEFLFEASPLPPPHPPP